MTYSISTAALNETSAQVIAAQFRADKFLPTREDFYRILEDPQLIPAELRVFDLVFPRVVDKGLSEGGGVDKVTDDSIASLVWDGSQWKPHWHLAGKDGWGRSGPDHFGVRARLIRIDSRN